MQQTPTTAIQALKIARQEMRRALAMSPGRAIPINAALEHLNDAIRDEEEDPSQAAPRSPAPPSPGRPAGETHKCAAIDCQQQIAKSLAFCRSHWFGLPLALQGKIHQTYTTYLDSPTEDNRAAHLASVREATIHLKDQPPARAGDRRRR